MCEERERIISCILRPGGVSSHVGPSYGGDRREFDHRYSQEVMDTILLEVCGEGTLSLTGKVVY